MQFLYQICKRPKEEIEAFNDSMQAVNILGSQSVTHLKMKLTDETLDEQGVAAITKSLEQAAEVLQRLVNCCNKRKKTKSYWSQPVGDDRVPVELEELTTVPGQNDVNLLNTKENRKNSSRNQDSQPVDNKRENPSSGTLEGLITLLQKTSENIKKLPPQKTVRSRFNAALTLVHNMKIPPCQQRRGYVADLTKALGEAVTAAGTALNMPSAPRDAIESSSLTPNLTTHGGGAA